MSLHSAQPLQICTCLNGITTLSTCLISSSSFLTANHVLVVCMCAGVKPGKSFGAGRGRDSAGVAKRGAPARPSAAAWQGMRTKGQGKLVKGSAAKPRDAPAPEGAKSSGQKAAQEPGKGKRVGKRPSVAARKAGSAQKKGKK